MFVVTGASSGIGRATALELSARGEKVLGVARSRTALGELKIESRGKIEVLIADLSTPNGIDALVRELSETESLSGIVHAAGSLVEMSAIQDLSTDMLLSDMKIHVAVPLELNQRLASKLASGWIIYIDSYSAQTPRVGWSGYSIVKAAAQMAIRCTVEEQPDARILRVYPGAVKTPLVDAVLNSSVDSPTKQTFETFATEGKMVEPKQTGEYIANIVFHATQEQLASREAWDYNNPEDVPKGI